jgi:membrane protein DedA with SNARE-associated domain
VGSLVWCYALAYVGEQLGQRWDADPRVRAVLHKVDFLVAAVVLTAVAWFVWHKLRRRTPHDRAETR